MEIDKKIESVKSDISKGYKTRAINRLQGLINAYPNVLEFREELGKLYEGVDWKEKSGLYYLLTETASDSAKENVNVYLKSINNSGYKALMDLKYKGDKELLPEAVKTTLEDLEQRSIEVSGTFPFYLHKAPNSHVRGQHQTTWRDQLVPIFAITMLLLLIALIFIGLVQVIKWIF